VQSLDWVVEIGEIDGRIRLGGWLILHLADEEFVLLAREIFTLRGIDVTVHTVDLWCGTQILETRSTLDAQFNFVVLQRNQWKRFGPVFTEEKWDHVVITRGTTGTFRISTDLGCGHRTRSLGLVIAVKNVVYTLNVQGIKTANFLATDEKREFRGTAIVAREQAIVVRQNIRDIWLLDPHVTQEITLGDNWHRDLVSTGKCTDVIHALWLEREVGVTLVVLTPEAHLWITRDVDILSPD
jgi:hypothetical protein